MVPGPPLISRRVGFGYRYLEVPLPPLGNIKSSEFKRTRAPPKPYNRQPMMVSLGVDIPGVAPPKPDLSCPVTAEAGIRKRFLHLPPKPDSLALQRFSQFVRNWLKENLVPLSAESDVGVLSWLEKCSYPLWRKEELLSLWNLRLGVLNPLKDFVVKSFIKDETYPEFKHARGINSRADMFKIKVGPIFRLIEEQVFKLPYFIKKIPVADRPKYIVDHLCFEGAKYFEGDFKAFESHFTREIMESCEFLLFEYMTQNLPEGREWMNLVRNVIGGRNHCCYKYFTVDVDATRMSGEMDTSLANGFANLMLLLFLFSEKGIVPRVVVEGDDSLTSFVGVPPDESDFTRLGFSIKCNVRENINEASFCGIIFHPSDLINITDPLDVLVNFGWAGRSYVNARRGRLLALLRCKSLSYAHQYPGAPIIQALAHYGLRATSGIDVRHFIENDRSLSLWEREQLRSVVNAPHPVETKVPIDTRLLMEKLYGLSVQTQLHIEQYLENLTSIQPLAGPICNLVFHPDCYRFADSYVMDLLPDQVGSPNFTWPLDKNLCYEFTPVVHSDFLNASYKNKTK